MAEIIVNRRTVLGWLTVLSGAVLGLPAGWAAGVGERCAPTRADILGPFYLPGAPYRTALAHPEEPGERLVIRGMVLGPDCKTPMAGALLDVWHADARGNYHDAKENYRLRGQLQTNAKGEYEFTTIRPGRYPLRGSMRPAHIHFTIKSPGYQPLTTQLYFKGDQYLAPNDPCKSCASDDSGLIIELQMEGTGWLSGAFDIVLTRSG